MGRGGHWEARAPPPRIFTVGQKAICPEKNFVFSRKLRDVRGSFVICPENFFWYVRKIFLVTSPPYRSPTILVKNINVYFACSGKPYCAPQTRVGPYAHGCEKVGDCPQIMQ